MHWKLGWHHIRNDQYAPQHDFVSTSVGVLKAFSQHMIAGSQGENKKNQKIQVNLRWFNWNTILAEQDNSHKFALLCFKTIFKYEANNSFCCWFAKLRAVILNIFGGRELQDFCSTEQ